MNDAGAAQSSGRSATSVQLRALLGAYFRIAARGKAGQALSRRWGGNTRSLLVVVGFYLFLGLFVGAFGATHPDIFTFSLILHTMTFFMVGMALTAESGDILFNPAEAEVIGPLPVPPRVHLMAKTLNVLAYALLLSVSFNLPGMFFGLAARNARPWFPIAHLSGVVLLSAFCAAAVVFVYGLIIRLVDRERFDNFAAYAQVGMAIVFILGYQVVPRLLRRMEGLDLRWLSGKLMPFPPAWFAGWDTVTGSGTWDGRMLVLALIGIAATSLLAYAAVVKLSRGFEEGVRSLAEAPVRKARPVRRGIESSFPIRLWLRDPVERASFRLAAAYMLRDRETKLRLYPSLSFVLIFPLLRVIDPARNGPGFLTGATFWMMGLVPVIALETLRHSSQFAASEIFRASPLASTAPIFHGFRKAAMIYVLLPAFVIGMGLLIAIIPDRASFFTTGLPALVVLPTLSLAPGLSGQYLPLSEPPVRGSSGRSVRMMIISMVVAPIVFGGAYLARRANLLWPVLGCEVVLLAFIHRGINRRIARCGVPPLDAADRG
jgi:ABC-2 type transport system permease protein